MAQNEIAEIRARVTDLEIDNRALRLDIQTLMQQVQTLIAENRALHGAIRVAGAAASNSAATNKAAADQNFPWYVPYLKMTCREQSAHVSCHYSY